MKQLKMTALAIALSTAAASSAMAQSAKTNSWEGVYAEAAVGYAQFNPTITNASLLHPLLGTLPVTTQQNNLSTATNKIGAGYTFGINEKYTLGIAASYSLGASSAASGTFTAMVPALYGGPSTKWFNYQLKNIWSVTLNPGYVIDKDSLVYAKVGATGLTMGINGQTADYQTQSFSGYVLGLGYKQMLTQSIYMLGEVNYANISSKTATIATSSGPLTGTLGGSGMDVIVGLGYRF